MDLPRGELAVGLDELVAGEQDGDPRAASAGDGSRLPPAARAPSSDAPSSVPAARISSPASMSSPRAADVPARLRRDPDRDRPVAALAVLDADDGVGALGEHRAGRDRDRLAGADRGGGGMAGARLADHGQLSGLSRGRGSDVGGADRLAVHRRVVEAGHVDAGADRRREPPALGLAERHVLRTRRPDAARAPAPRASSISISPTPGSSPIAARLERCERGERRSLRAGEAGGWARPKATRRARAAAR